MPSPHPKVERPEVHRDGRPGEDVRRPVQFSDAADYVVRRIEAGLSFALKASSGHQGAFLFVDRLAHRLPRGNAIKEISYARRKLDVVVPGPAQHDEQISIGHREMVAEKVRTAHSASDDIQPPENCIPRDDKLVASSSVEVRLKCNVQFRRKER